MGSRLGEWVDTLADNMSYLVFLWRCSPGCMNIRVRHFIPAGRCNGFSRCVGGIADFSVYETGGVRQYCEF